MDNEIKMIFVIALVTVGLLLISGCERLPEQDLGSGTIVFKKGTTTGYCDKIIFIPERYETELDRFLCVQGQQSGMYYRFDISTIVRVRAR